jgi:hypothetical protein
MCVMLLPLAAEPAATTPAPDPAPLLEELATLRRENAALRSENAVLHERIRENVSELQARGAERLQEKEKEEPIESVAPYSPIQ